MTARPDSLDELGDDTYCEVAQLAPQMPIIPPTWPTSEPIEQG